MDLTILESYRKVYLVFKKPSTLKVETKLTTNKKSTVEVKLNLKNYKMLARH